MCEITNKNFENKFAEIISDLQSASLISYDCEFSGLFDDDNKCSLFDTPKERFNKLQTTLKDFSIIQFGLSTFRYERSSNSFSVSSYCFYLKPATVFGNKKFTYQRGSIEFLCKNNFNFNKLFYEGIDYLCQSDEKVVLKMIDSGGLITRENEEQIQKYKSAVAEWSSTASEGSEMLLELNDESQTLIYLLHWEIRKQFTNIWTYFTDNFSIRLKKLSEDDKKLLISNHSETELLRKKLFESYLGFSRIIKEIELLKKPLVGHNIFMDLIMIYKQFYNPSWISYKGFKKAVTSIFPNIYDTKCVSFSLRELLKREDKWNSNILSDLYHYLKDGRGATLVIYTPLIRHTDENYTKSEHFHNAGFDSYSAGFCLIKMAHILSLFDKEKRAIQLTSLRTSMQWLLKALEPLKNQVNVMRGQVNHIHLDREDPKSVRPGLLYIQSKTKPLDISKVSEATAKYGSVDIQLLSKQTGLMALSNQKQEKQIMECLKNHKEFKISKYKFLKHSNLGRTILCITCIGSILLVKLCLKKLSQS